MKTDNRQEASPEKLKQYSISPAHVFQLKQERNPVLSQTQTFNAGQKIFDVCGEL